MVVVSHPFARKNAIRWGTEQSGGGVFAIGQCASGSGHPAERPGLDMAG
jgi:hypothetical protein